jgi:predicted alpha/beta superfamily hydrolase
LGEFRSIDRFRSRFLDGERQVTIYLPPGYRAAPDRRYPVLYLQDGQNLFDPRRSFVPGETWHAHESIRALSLAGEIEPLIAVGIDHGGANRIDEYTPTQDLRSRRGGKAKAYGRMLVEELKPLIDSEFRTKPEACNTGLGGSSLGGLVTLYLGFRLPHIFGRLAIMSPSLWWDRKIMLQRLRANIHRRRSWIWVDIGTREGRYYNQTVANTRLLRDELIKRGWAEGRDLGYYEDLGATHSERAWAHRFPMMLRYLFPAPGRPNPCDVDPAPAPAPTPPPAPAANLKSDPIW